MLGVFDCSLDAFSIFNIFSHEVWQEPYVSLAVVLPYDEAKCWSMYMYYYNGDPINPESKDGDILLHKIGNHCFGWYEVINHCFSLVRSIFTWSDIE